MPRQNHDDTCNDDVLYERNPMSPTIRAINSMDRRCFEEPKELDFTHKSHHDILKMAMKQYGIKG